MERFLQRWAGTGAVAAVLGAAIAGAMRVNYAAVVGIAVAGLGLLFVSLELSRRRVDRALAELSSAWGAPVVERVQEVGGEAWFAERGFADYAGQLVRRMRTRAVESAGGSVAVIDAWLGPGKSARWRAAVLSAPAPAPGAIVLYPADARDRRRARWLGGTVATDLGRFVAFGADPAAAAAAARAIDAEAVDALFERMRALGARWSPGFAVDGTRASVILEGSPPDALAPESVRETLAALRRCVRS